MKVDVGLSSLDRSAESLEKAEIRQFFRELVDSTLHILEMYEDESIEKPIQRLRVVRESCSSDIAVRIGTISPIFLTWSVLRQLADDGNPELAAELWESTLRHAAEAQISSEAAYATIKTNVDSPYEKARFKALVADFAASWHPRNGIEWGFIHHLAQSQILYDRWLRKLVDRMTFEGINDSDLMEHSNGRAHGPWVVPRVSEYEAIEQAQQMADRFQKAMLRIIRSMRDLRRHAPVIIQNAEQVNLGERQINVQSPDSLTLQAQPKLD